MRLRPHPTSLVLTSCIIAANVLPMAVETSVAAMRLGAGDRPTSSVIEGLVMTEAHDRLVPQAPLLFSPSGFLGVFGFPLVAGALLASGSGGIRGIRTDVHSASDRTRIAHLSL